MNLNCLVVASAFFSVLVANGIILEKLRRTSWQWVFNVFETVSSFRSEVSVGDCLGIDNLLIHKPFNSFIRSINSLISFCNILSLISCPWWIVRPYWSRQLLRLSFCSIIKQLLLIHWFLRSVFNHRVRMNSSYVLLLLVSVTSLSRSSSSVSYSIEYWDNRLVILIDVYLLWRSAALTSIGEGFHWLLAGFLSILTRRSICSYLYYLIQIITFLR